MRIGARALIDRDCANMHRVSDHELTCVARDLTARTRVAAQSFFLFERDAGLRGVFDVYRAAQHFLTCFRGADLNLSLIHI